MQLKKILSYLESVGIEYQFEGDSSKNYDNITGLNEASDSDMSFLSDSKRLKELEDSSAGVFLLKDCPDFLSPTRAILVENPYFAFAKLSQLFHDKKIIPGVAASAVIGSGTIVPQSCQVSENVVIGQNVTFGESCYIGPGAVVLDGSTIGEQTHISANVTVMNDCVIGNEVRLEPGCVIGNQGFGFANQSGEWSRILQVGRVVIGDRVFIGSNTTINRGAVTDTIIESNTIIDCLVQVAHNVKIGYGSAVAAQTGFAGSSEIGKYCIFGGQTAVNGHIQIADGSQFHGKTGVTHSIKEAGSYSGFPAEPTKEWQRNTVRAKNLKKMSQQIKALETELKELKLKLEN